MAISGRVASGAGFLGILLVFFLFLGSAQAKSPRAAPEKRPANPGPGLVLAEKIEPDSPDPRLKSLTTGKGGKETVFDPSKAEMLILQLRFKRYVLLDAFVGYLHRGGLLLPLGEIVRAVDFAINVNPAAGQAEGWFLRENRRFALDVPAGEVVVEGKKKSLPSALVSVQPEAIYVDSTLFGKWFPIDVEYDLSSLLVEVKAEETLPLEARLEREKQRERLGARAGFVAPEYPGQDIPYKFFDLPHVDVSYNTDFDSETNQIRQNYTSLFSGDFLYQTSDVFLSGDQDEEVSELRWKMGRKDPHGNLIGPLGVTEYSAGDIFSPQFPLISDSGRGAGFEISSFRLDRPSEFDRTNLRGDLPIGWEVELYRNEILINSQAEPNAEGRYEFLNVPLLFGNNVLRLVFYGPQGQKREEVQTIFVGAQQVRPGQQYFRVALNRQERDLFQIGEEETTDEFKGDPRAFAEYELGVTRRFSIAANVATLPIRDVGRRYFATLGVRASVLGTFSRLEFVKDDQGGTATQATVQTDILGLNLLAEHKHFFDEFISEQFENQTDPTLSLSNLRLDKIIPSWGIIPRISANIRGQLERFDSNRKDIDLSNRLSAFVAGVSVTNTVDFALTRGGDAESTTRGDGTFLLSARLLQLSLRGSLNYAITPKADLTSAAVTADYRVGRKFSTRLAVDRTLTGDNQVTTVTAGVNRRFQWFDFGIDASYEDEGRYTVGASLSFSIGQEPRTKGLVVSSERMASNGSASARVFLDRNQDGRYNEGDQPIQGAKLRPGPRELETDEEGIALIPGLTHGRETPVTVQKESLEDPFWIITQEGYEIVPRPGRPAILDFPVVPTGEIDGTVYLRKGELTRAVSNVQLQLLDEEGEVVQEVKSAFDGFYLFQMVTPGTYRVRVSPEQTQRLNLIVPPEREVTIKKSGSIESFKDLVIDLPKEENGNGKNGGKEKKSKESSGESPKPEPAPAGGNPGDENPQGTESAPGRSPAGPAPESPASGEEAPEAPEPPRDSPKTEPPTKEIKKTRFFPRLRPMLDKENLNWFTRLKKMYGHPISTRADYRPDRLYFRTRLSLLP